ncbi:hypothetical protein N7520_007543 [Penicillium odoratum]|uniref:uncharacterized protein n=1 Tax=Penicillium odoratum TaxID=1167516 RepID=UPI002547807F|nr:uncharacterized protein N7520_007543 [Penicillium odoratum]KAJ5760387.1 hypothetical protein N7520_007543 [Penicillium odoratum]
MDSKVDVDELPKFRILMIHGFAGSDSEFRAKSSRIWERINEVVTPDILDEFPGGIEFLHPNGTLVLEPPIGFGGEVDDEDDKGNLKGTMMGDDSVLGFMGWWYGRDTVSRYRGVEASLSYIARFIYGRPIHAIIGFSQGACLAGMIASLLDCDNNPEKVAAIRAQDLPIDDFLNLPGQESIRFFIGMGGYRGTLKYYGSLYQWPIDVPSCHTLANFDAIVKPFQTMDLAHCFTSCEIIRYYGSHYVPRDRISVESLANFALRNSCRESTSSRFPPVASTTSQSDTDETQTVSSGRSQALAAFPVWTRSRKINVTRSRRLRPMLSRRFM